MFECEFEFTVDYPIEECEERIQSLQRGGCFGYLRSTSVHSMPFKDEPISEFRISQRIGRGRLEIEGIIEQIKHDTSVISGKGYFKNIQFVLGILMLGTVMMLVAGVLAREWFLVIVAIVFNAYIWWFCILLRNHYIKMLEKTLIRPKKKRA